MKNNIHPQWNAQAQVTCACGNSFTLGSTKSPIQVDICSECHPFFTQEMRFVDCQGRVDRCRQKMAAAANYQASGKKSKKEKAKNQDTLSFKDILNQGKAA